MTAYLRLISGRYILRRRTGLLAVLAVTFGVATLLTVLSIMEGYIIELQAMIREQEAHVIIRGGPLGLRDIDFYERLKEVFGGQAISGGNYFLKRDRRLFVEPRKRIPRIQEISPFIETPAMYRSGKLNPCYLRGIDPEKEILVTSLGKFLLRPAELDAILSHRTQGLNLEEFQRRAEEKARKLLETESRPSCSPKEALELFSRRWRRELFRRENPAIADDFDRYSMSSVVVGFHVLATRNIDIGQVISIVTMNPRTSVPVNANFLVTGAIKTGDHEADSSVFLVHINRLKSLFDAYTDEGEERFDGVRIALEDYRDAEDVSVGLMSFLFRRGFVEARIYTWKDVKPIFVQAVKTEKWIMWLLLLFLNVFTGCMILLMLVLIVIEKTRDAGILLAMGATPRGVFSIFLLNGMMITGLGTVLGLIMGWVFSMFLNKAHDGIYWATGHKLFDPEVYGMDHIPSQIGETEVLLSVLPALVFGVLASLLPALWASRKDPIQAIHHE